MKTAGETGDALESRPTPWKTNAPPTFAWRSLAAKNQTRRLAQHFS